MGSEGDEIPSAQSILLRISESRPRLAGTAAALLWAAAILVLILHANHILVRSDGVFTACDTWLIGLGCIGAPPFALKALGKRLSVRACEMLAVIAFCYATILTVILATGAWALGQLTALFILIILLAIGIQTLNAAQDHDRVRIAAAKAYTEGRHEGKTEGLILAYQAINGRREEMQALLSSDTGELQKLSGEVLREIERRRDSDGDASAGHIAEVLQLFKDAQPGQQLLLDPPGPDDPSTETSHG